MAFATRRAKVTYGDLIARGRCGVVVAPVLRSGACVVRLVRRTDFNHKLFLITFLFFVEGRKTAKAAASHRRRRRCLYSYSCAVRYYYFY
jgi:hypothetical protein